MADPRTKYTFNQPPLTAREWANAGNGDIGSGNAKYFEFVDPDARQAGGGSESSTPGNLPGGTAGGTALAANSARVTVAGGYILNESSAALRVTIFSDETAAAAGTAHNEANLHFVVPAGSLGNPAEKEWSCMTRAIQIKAVGGAATYTGGSKDFWIKGLK